MGGLLTVEELADHFKCSVRTVYRLLKTGKLNVKIEKYSQRTVRYSLSVSDT